LAGNETKGARLAYQLYYWPALQGRGEFVRLALEEAGAAYVYVVRGHGQGRGVAAMMRLMDSPSEVELPFAPPILRDGDRLVSHVANILAYLGPKLRLAPRLPLRPFANGLQLTITDMLAEVHDTHHPLSSALYYEDQKPEAKASSQAFLKQRMPKYLGYFERVLAQNLDGPGHAVGAKLTTVDLSLFQLLAGLRYAFPRATSDVETLYPRLTALAGAVAARPRIAAYLKSDRRIPFNQTGVFRHYPELDQDP
jgi:glutathione S-transferase